MSIQSINPATGEVLETFEPYSREQVNTALDAARDAQRAWRVVPFAERARLMHRAAACLREHKDEYARTITLEMGKPITEALAEIEKCAWNCNYFADSAEAMLANTPAPSNARESYVEYVPLGIVLAIMPWNFPFWQVFRFAAPGLMARNGVILKHASNVPRCSLQIAQVFEEAGFPKGLFASILIPGEEAEKLIADPRIAAVTLTGSTPAGQRVAAAAGRVIKKQVLELGGSDYFIVLDDADLENAAKTGVRARFQNTGQSCIAAKRFIVQESVADEFERLFVEQVRALTVGDPLQQATQIGPMARVDLREALVEQVRKSLDMGARAVGGGEALPGKGFYYAPTVLTNATTAMPVFREETFGPVAPIFRVKSGGEAVALANDTEFGLGGNLWTRDIGRARALARHLESGNVFINGMTASDPRLPFGGVKQSGYGRELSRFGIHEFVNIQTVWIGPAQEASATPQTASE